MENTVKELASYIVGEYGERYTKGQKYYFRKFLKKRAEAAGRAYREISSEDGKCTDVIAGNLSKAAAAVVCPYDTPARSVLPGKKYYPMDPDKNIRENTKEMLFRLFLCFIAILFIIWSRQNHIFPQNAVSTAALFVVFFFIFWFILSYHPNRYNFTRNSAAIVVMLQMMEDPGNRNCVYIFLDQQAGSNKGIKLLDEKISLEGKKCIYLDCIGTGEGISVFTPEKSRMNQLLDAGKREINYMPVEEDKTARTLFQFLPGAFLITCGKQDSQGDLFVEHTGTARDDHMYFNQLGKIENCIKFLCKAGGSKKS